MNGKVFGFFQIASLVVSASVPMAANAQGGDSLESQLAAKYKLAKVGQDSTGVSVTDPGTVLVIKKGGILSVPSSQTVLLPNFVKDGEVHSANGSAMAGVSKLLKWKGVSDPTGSASTDTKYLTIGEKVYVNKIDINRKDSKVSLAIIECDTCNNVQQPSQRKAQVVFQFPKDYLSGADGGQISDVIGQILDVDQGDDQQQQAQDQGQQGGQQGGGQQAAQQQQQQGPPPTVQLGQSMDDVKAIMGQPDKIMDLRVKQIFVYKDLKVIFINNKVVDVQ